MTSHWEVTVEGVTVYLALITLPLPSRTYMKGGYAIQNSRPGVTVSGRSQYFIVVVLAPLNGTFEKKTLIVPFGPDVLKLGRQTTAKSLPAADNGFFDSRVLSRQHAEMWADRQTGKLYIRDSASSNGTYINGDKIGNGNQKNSEDNKDLSSNVTANDHELKKDDVLDLGIDICAEDGVTLLHKKISAQVERIFMLSVASDKSQTVVEMGAKTNTANNKNASTINNKPFNTFKHKRHSSTDESKRPPLLSLNPQIAQLAGLDVVQSPSGGALNGGGSGDAPGMSGGIPGMPLDSGAAVIDNVMRSLLTESRAIQANNAQLQSVTELLQQIQQKQQQFSNLQLQLTKNAANASVAELTVTMADLKSNLNEKEEEIELLIEEKEALQKTVEDLRKRLDRAESQSQQCRLGVPASSGFAAPCSQNGGSSSSPSVSPLDDRLPGSPHLTDASSDSAMDMNGGQHLTSTIGGTESIDISSVSGKRVAPQPLHKLPIIAAILVVLLGVGGMYAMNNGLG